jgi:uncharacterized protein YjbI with pentapeptide repeats
LITALTAVGALIFTALSLNSTRDQVSIAQSQSAISEQGQFTERYSKAVEQIGQQGPDHLQVRLGGIYALERLSRDSLRDQPTIVEVLSAFIRTTAKPLTSCIFSSPTSDIQAALTVLGRRDATHDNNTYVDLTYTCLNSYKLPRATLGHADLRNSDFTGTDLTDADLANADLTGANLRVTQFADANLTDANLLSTQLTGANLSDAQLINSVLSGADLGGANLRRANLRGARLNGAILTKADLYKADLRSAHLGNADLAGANLAGADLAGADLRGANHQSDTVVAGANKDVRTRGAWW